MKIVMMVILIVTQVYLLPTIAFCSGIPVIHPDTLTVDAAIVAIKQAFTKLLEEVIALEYDNEKELAENKQDTAATIQKTAEGEASAYAAMYKQHAVALNTIQNSREYSPLAQSSYACCSQNLGVGLLAGINQEKINEGAIYSAVFDYNDQFISNEEAFNTLRSVGSNDRADQAWTIFPLHETSSDSMEDVAANIILNTNPLPAKKLTADLLNTEPGKHYEVLRMIQLSKLSIPQSVMSEIANHQLPAYPLADWHKQMQKAKGVPSGSSAAVVGGKLSSDAVLKAQVHSRYGNPNWGVDLHRKYTDGVLRELIEMESIDLELQRRLLKTGEQRLALFAQDHARQIAEQYDEQLEYLRGQAISQQVVN